MIQSAIRSDVASAGKKSLYCPLLSGTLGPIGDRPFYLYWLSTGGNRTMVAAATIVSCNHRAVPPSVKGMTCCLAACSSGDSHAWIFVLRGGANYKCIGC